MHQPADTDLPQLHKASDDCADRNDKVADVAAYGYSCLVHARPTLMSQDVAERGPSILLMIRAASSLEMG